MISNNSRSNLAVKNLYIAPGGALCGNIYLPGDKSITHRALILSAIYPGPVIIKNWLASLDCLATLRALAVLGVEYEHIDQHTLKIYGVGLHGLQAPQQVLDVGNSGTAMRLLTGLLAAQKFAVLITGDKSLRSRPMHRIIVPLEQMGAKIFATENNFAPLHIIGGQKLQAIKYTMPMASAQVKSAILLADLYAVGDSTIIEPAVSRNHTEIMLDYFKHAAQKNISLSVPGDISAAAFFMVGASISKNSELTINNVGVNPTRTGIIDILRAMGANITLKDIALENGELRASIYVKSAKLTGITVPLDLVANAIDEFPILAIAAACATGTTVFRGAQELRYKESDRIAAIAAGLTSLGIKNQVFADGMKITGGRIGGGNIDSQGDHRIAMAFAMAGLVAEQPIIIQDTANIATSFPNFTSLARQAGLLLTESTEERYYA